MPGGGRAPAGSRGRPALGHQEVDHRGEAVLADLDDGQAIERAIAAEGHDRTLAIGIACRERAELRTRVAHEVAVGVGAQTVSQQRRELGVCREFLGDGPGRAAQAGQRQPVLQERQRIERRMEGARLPAERGGRRRASPRRDERRRRARSNRSCRSRTAGTP